MMQEDKEEVGTEEEGCKYKEEKIKNTTKKRKKTQS